MRIEIFKREKSLIKHKKDTLSKLFKISKQKQIYMRIFCELFNKNSKCILNRMRF